MAAQSVYLSLGSNLGDRKKNLDDAIAALSAAGLRLQALSSVYETEPVDYLEQPWFLNRVVHAKTQLDPLALLRALQKIEEGLGRKRTVPKGPRIIDLDILLFGDEIINTPELQVPHPRMLQRRFVLLPLSEIAAKVRHPSWDANVEQLIARSADQSQVHLFR